MCARISTYPNDTNVIGADRWIGSQSDNNDVTKNFTADAVASYFNRSAIIDTGQFSWDFIPYNNTQPQPEKTFMKVGYLNDSININNLEGVLRVSALTLGNQQPGDFIAGEWVGQNILIHIPGAPSAYCIYTVDSLVLDGSWYYLMELSFVSGVSFTLLKNKPLVFGYFGGANLSEVYSVFGRTGDIVAEYGDYTTSLVPEGTNLYFTTARARESISTTVTGLLYSNSTGILSLDTGYFIPTTTQEANWNLGYNNSIVSASVTGTSSKTLTLNQQDGGTITTVWSDYSPVDSVFGRTGAIVAANGDYNTSQVTEQTNLYFTDARSRSAISLTTTGTSGAATYSSSTGVLNIPQYQGGVTSFNTRTGAVTLTSGDVTGALGFTPYNATNPDGFITSAALAGYVPITRTITVNGDTQALSANVSFSVAGGVTSFNTRTGAITLTSGDVTTALGFTPENAANKGIANGYASLDSNGTVPTTQLPASIVGGLNYQGVWNATTNTPTLTQPQTGVDGYFYIVNVAGVQFGIDFEIGDWIVNGDNIWSKIDNTDKVASVFGRTGIVTAQSGDYTTTLVTEGTNLYYTDTRARASISLTTTGTSGAATYNTATGELNIPNYAAAGTGLPAGGTAGQILSKIDAVDYNTEWIDNYATQVKNEVKLGAALTIGTPVYVSGANGTNIIVSASSNTTEAGSSKTFGLLEIGGALNDIVKCVTYGLIDGLDTSAANAAGDPVWLGPNGTLLYGLANKPYAPAHMVYIGVVTRKQSNNGEIFVNIQNGFELDELHNVSARTPSNNDILYYSTATSLWQTASIPTVLGYTPEQQLTFSSPLSRSVNTISIPAATSSVNGYLTSTDWSTFNSKEPAITAGTTAQYWRGDKTFQTLNTSVVPEGTNLYFTNSRARLAISLTNTGTSGAATYDNATGIFNIPTYQGQITLTTTGTSGPATFSSNTLNIPQYSVNPSARNENTFTATAGQTTFTITGGYTVGLVDVYVNGAKYAPADFTATNGTTVVLGVPLLVGDIVDIINYTSAIAVLPTSRDVIDYTATAAQTTFTVSGGYTVGLLDVYVNGTKLTSSEVTATNGTTFVLTVASVVGDQVQAIRYNSSVTGISGSGTANYVPKFTATGTIGNSSIITDASNNVLINTTSSTGAINTDANRSNLVLGAATSSKISFNNGSTTATGFIYNSTTETSIGYPLSGSFSVQQVGGGNRMTINSSGTVYINATSGGYSAPRLYVDNGATTSIGFVIVSDNAGRLARFNNRDYNDTNTGSSLRFGFGSGTGDTFATINAYKSGESTTGNLILNQGGGQVAIGTTSVKSVLGSNTKLTVAGSGSNGGGVAGASVGSIAGSGTGAVGLDISIDALDGGLTLIFLASRNTAAGTSTASAVYIISFYYSDNNFPSISYLGGTSNFVSFGSSGGKLTATNSAGGNWNYSWFASK